jgi:hypothetical protein
VAKTISGEFLMTFSSLIFAGEHTIALSAIARISVHVCVFGGIFMPFRTMSDRSFGYLQCLYGCGVTVSASQVLLEGDRLKMPRIDAATDSAQMVQLKAFGDWAYEHFIAESMGLEIERVTTLSIEDDSIATDIKRASPEPASAEWVLRYALPELLFSVTPGPSHSILLQSFWSWLRGVISVAAARFHFTHIPEGIC